MGRPEQLRQFLQEITSHRLYPAFYLLATTGMRRGEVLGLRWSDVDLDGHLISVSVPRDRRLRAAVVRRQDRPESPNHRPRTQDGCSPTYLEETPEGRAHAHQPAARNRLDVRSPGRIVDQSGLLQPGLRSPCQQVRPTGYSPTRSPPHACFDPAEPGRSSQGRQ